MSIARSSCFAAALILVVHAEGVRSQDELEFQRVFDGLEPGNTTGEVAIDGDDMAIVKEDGLTFFRRDCGFWRQTAHLPRTDLRWALEISDGRVVVSARASGYAVIFRREREGVWVEEQVIRPACAICCISYVAIDGDRVAIAGDTCVSLFTLEGETWTPEQVLPKPDRSWIWAIELDGEILLVGPRVYRRTGGEWRLEHTFDTLEIPVKAAVNGNRIIMGYTNTALSRCVCDAVDIFEHDGDSWSLMERIENPGGFGRFGSRVDLDGDVAVIKDGNLWAAGASVYVHRFDGASWELEHTLRDPVAPFGNVYFGIGLRISEDTIAVGGETGTYAYDLSPPQALFNVSAESVSPDEEIVFDASSAENLTDAEITSYEWDFGDGNTGAGVTARHAYAQPGRRYVTLRVFGADGECQSTRSLITAECPVGELGPWMTAAVGEPAFTGGARFVEGGDLAICGGGDKIAGHEDELRFVYQERTGDATLTARLGDFEPTNPYPGIGIMMRGSLEADARHLFVYVSNRSRGLELRFARRRGPSSNHRTLRSVTLPVWMRIAREGDELVVYARSGDEPAFEEVRRFDDIELPETMLAGVAAVAGDLEPDEPFVPPSWLISELRLEPDASESGPRFVRGDCNGDGAVSGNPTDAAFLLNFLFGGGREPECLAACDSDGSGTTNLADAVYVLAYNFLGGPAPVAPFPDCGPLAEDEKLACDTPPQSCTAR